MRQPARDATAGQRRLAALLIRHSHGAWREAKPGELLAAAAATIGLWQAAGQTLDFAELAEDIAGEARLARQLSEQIAGAYERIAALYGDADPCRDRGSAPGLGSLWPPGSSAARCPNRFANLAGVRAFTGLVPTIDQSGTSSRHGRPTKAGDPGLREALFLAADRAPKVDPTFLAARYFGRLLPPAHRGRAQTSRLRALSPGRRPGRPHRGLLVQRRALRVA